LRKHRPIHLRHIAGFLLNLFDMCPLFWTSRTPFDFIPSLARIDKQFGIDVG